MIYINNELCSTKKDEETGENVLKCDENPYAIILLGGIFYPFIYECIQCAKQGPLEYITVLKNWGDMAYIGGSIAMSISHLVLDPFQEVSKIIMICVIVLSIIRTFKFMRIFSDFSPIVTMLAQVVVDLQQFMLFYTILIALFSLLWGTIGMGNTNEQVNAEYSKAWKEPIAEGESGYPGVAYAEIGLFAGNLFDVLRTTLGDFACIDMSLYLEYEETVMFWVGWLLFVIVGNIIFLNFIIAEASASYEKVSERLAEFIEKEKANLIAESEGMTPNVFKSMHNYPKYIIVR